VFSGLVVLLVYLLSLTSLEAHEQTRLFNVVNLEVRVETEVPNNLMIVVLSAEEEGRDPASISQQINSTMRWALAVSEEAPDINIKTGNYRTNPVYSEQTITGWRATQTLILESEEVSRLSQLVGTLQERLQVKQMRFKPTSQQMKSYEDSLVHEGMRAFRHRAEQLREHMDNRPYRIINININTGRRSPPVQLELSTAATLSTATAPAVEAGSSKLTVTVSGSVQYSP